MTKHCAECPLFHRSYGVCLITKIHELIDHVCSVDHDRVVKATAIKERTA